MLDQLFEVDIPSAQLRSLPAVLGEKPARTALAKRLLSEAEACVTEVRPPRLLATLGALLFGISITKAMLGRRDE